MSESYKQRQIKKAVKAYKQAEADLFFNAFNKILNDPRKEEHGSQESRRDSATPETKG
jgi:hypothetical protein